MAVSKYAYTSERRELIVEGPDGDDEVMVEIRADDGDLTLWLPRWSAAELHSTLGEILA